MNIKRLYSGCNNFSTKVCIVGSGPAGFYVAQQLLKALPNVTVDMYEKLPVPFGLVRYGVAPDHPEVKNVINTFTKTASNQNFRFIGNVTLGKDIRFKDFQNAYHAVVLSYGCNEEKKLGINGEDKIISARRIVGWYNGLPADKDLDLNLNCDKCVIIGQGNVAIDIARIFLTPVDLLKKTDITSFALEALAKSKIRKVYLVGRRGPLHVAFTIKEFREMTKLPDVRTVFRTEDLRGLDDCLPMVERPRKRLTELLLKTASIEQKGNKEFCPLFFRKPSEIFGEEMKFCITSVKDNLKGVVIETKEVEKINSSLFVGSVGYKGTRADCDIPFDTSKGVVRPQPGVYACGWISTGPVGVIISTMNDAFQKAALLVNDIQSNKINVNILKPGYEHIKEILSSKGVTTVSFEGWRKIDKVEVENGEKAGKPREKIVDIEKMLEIGGE